VCVKKFSISIDEDLFERFEDARKKYKPMNRSNVIEVLIKQFMGEEVYFK